jgi:hypothetical protein
VHAAAPSADTEDVKKDDSAKTNERLTNGPVVFPTMSQLVHGGDGGSDANDHMVADEQNMTIIGEIEGEEQNTTIVQV